MGFGTFGFLSIQKYYLKIKAVFIPRSSRRLPYFTPLSALAGTGKTTSNNNGETKPLSLLPDFSFQSSGVVLCILSNILAFTDTAAFSSLMEG